MVDSEQTTQAASSDDDRRTGEEALSRLRVEIDEVDDRLVELIARRLELALETRKVKAQYGLEVRDTGREAAVVRKAAEKARAKNLETETVRAIFWRLIDLSWWGYDRADRLGDGAAA